MEEAEIEEAGGDEEADYDDDGVGVESYEEGIGDCGDVSGGGGDEEDGEDPVEEEGRYGGLFRVGLLAEAGGEEFGFEVGVGGCGAGGEEEGEGEDAFFGDFLLDFEYSQFLLMFGRWFSLVDLTPGGCEGHDYNVTQDCERYYSRHDPRCCIIAEDLCEE